MTREQMREQPVGARIRWARKRAGMSQDQFAERLGTSRRHVMRWEGNRVQRLSDAYVDRIADATGQPADFFRDEEERGEGDELDAVLLSALRAVRAYVMAA